MPNLIRVTLIRPELPSKDENKKLVEDTEHDMVEVAGGFSRSQILGAYKNDKGKHVYEYNYRYEIVMDGTIGNLNAAHTWGASFKRAYPHEEAIFCLIEWVDSHGGYLVR